MNGENIHFIGKFKAIYFDEKGSININFSGETTDINKKVKANMRLCLRNNYTKNKFLEKIDILGFAHHYDTNIDEYGKEFDEEIFYIDVYSDISLYDKIVNKIDNNLYMQATIKKIDANTFRNIDELHYEETKDDKVKDNVLDCMEWGDSEYKSDDEVKDDVLDCIEWGDSEYKSDDEENDDEVKDDVLDYIVWSNSEYKIDYEENAKKHFPITFYNLIYSPKDEVEKSSEEVDNEQDNIELLNFKEEIRYDKKGFYIVLFIIVVCSLVFGNILDLYYALIIFALFYMLERLTQIYKLLRISNILNNKEVNHD